MNDLKKMIIAILFVGSMWACNDEGSDPDGSGDKYKNPARIAEDKPKDTVPAGIHIIN